MDVDPIRYEMFLHRLWAVGEEGRSTLQRVTASPIVAQGGEVMSSFYDAGGTMVLACSGHLRFAAATSDAIKQMIEWFESSPGFHDGDQLFFNDPYVAGSHTYDMMVVKPIFLDGRLIAWIATSTHTADTGGVLRGGALEIYHEGIRILGVKVVERGEFREDVFRTLTEQCRDPQYVGLDIKAMIAGNNVCAARYLSLVDKFGLDFIEAAGQKTLADAEEMARAKLRSLPDGIWRSRVYYSAREADQSDADIIAVVCAVTKKGDTLDIDLDGTSPQTSGDTNSTLPSTVAHLNIALTNQLFWDIPWNDGKLAPIRMTVPEGSVLNCTFPAACGLAPMIGGMFVAAVSECLAKMLYTAGRMEDVNAGWAGAWYSGGPGFMYGGHNREGLATAQGLYDVHGGGLGARPDRDGVDTGGHMNIPSGGISDVERIEMQYPFIYLARRHVKDGAGFGRHRGGYGSERLLFVYGSQDLTANYRPYGAVPNGFGLFGGYPAGFGGNRALYRTEGLLQRLREGAYPTGADELRGLDWCRLDLPDGFRPRVAIPELSFITDVTQSGGGVRRSVGAEPHAGGTRHQGGTDQSRRSRPDLRRQAQRRQCGRRRHRETAGAASGPAPGPGAPPRRDDGRRQSRRPGRSGGLRRGGRASLPRIPPSRQGRRQPRRALPQVRPRVLRRRGKLQERRRRDHHGPRRAGRRARPLGANPTAVCCWGMSARDAARCCRSTSSAPAETTKDPSGTSSSIAWHWDSRDTVDPTILVVTR